MDFGAPPPDAVAEALVDSLALLAGAAELGWVRRAGGVTALLTDVPIATLNGVWATGADARSEQIDAGLDEVGESRLHAELAGAAFEAPPDLFATIITEATLGLPAVRGYVGEVGGTPVATAIAATVGDSVGVFNVATSAQHRRRGYGASVTSRAISDGRAAGATWSWLQSTEQASRVYRRLGLATLEQWSCWLSG
jgi:ribosomal protein S18 acetylase RimI-like enzyme